MWWPLWHRCVSRFSSPSINFSTIIHCHAIPPIPMSWTNLNLLFGCEFDQVRPLWKQLHWNRFLCWHWKPCQALFLFFFILTVSKGSIISPHTTHSLEESGVSWFVFVVVSFKQTNAGQGQRCALPGRSWYRGESRLSQHCHIWCTWNFVCTCQGRKLNLLSLQIVKACKFVCHTSYNR